MRTFRPGWGDSVTFGGLERMPHRGPGLTLIDRYDTGASPAFGIRYVKGRYVATLELSGVQAGS